MDETKPKKLVSRNVAIALGIICVILVAGLGGTLIVLNGANSKNASLQSQVNDLNNIIILNETEVCIYNWTNSIGPKKNITSLPIQMPFSGSVEVVGQIQPSNPNIWVSLTWTVYYWYVAAPIPYQVPETPWFSSTHSADSFDFLFPIVSFGHSNAPQSQSYIEITVGNNDSALTSTVNVTATLTY